MKPSKCMCTESMPRHQPTFLTFSILLQKTRKSDEGTTQSGIALLLVRQREFPIELSVPPDAVNRHLPMASTERDPLFQTTTKHMRCLRSNTKLGIAPTRARKIIPEENLGIFVHACATRRGLHQVWTWHETWTLSMLELRQTAWPSTSFFALLRIIRHDKKKAVKHSHVPRSLHQHLCNQSGLSKFH